MGKAMLVLATGVVVASAWAAGETPDPDRAARRVCQVRLVSEAEPETTSVESILKSILVPGASDEEKCLAIMGFVNEHRFWAPALRGADPGVNDPIILLNCYAPTICQQDAAVLCPALWNAAGYGSRYWQLGGHTTSEVFYGGRWRNLDATFPEVARDKDGNIVGVVEGNRRYKPGVSRVTPWDDYELGHRMDISLRKGESFTRHWGPLSKEPDYWRPAAEGGMPHDKGSQKRSLSEIMGRKPYRFGTQGCGYANGLWVFRPDFSDPRWQDVVESAVNLAAGPDGVLRLAAPGRPAELVLRVSTPYIITGGWLEAQVALENAEAKVTLMVSGNGGHTWEALWAGKGPGQEKVRAPLRDVAGGRFSYCVKLQVQGGARVWGMACETVVQANPLSLPALRLGQNTIRLDVGQQTERITWRPNVLTPEYRSEIASESNILTAREQSQEGWVRGLCVKKAGAPGEIRVDLRAPGDIQGASWGGWLRADSASLFYSFDGKEWRQQPLARKGPPSRSDAPKAFVAVYEAVPAIPKSQRTIHLRYRFERPEPKERHELWVTNALRADVDYVPRGLGQFRQLKVTYCWVEESNGKREEKTVTKAADDVPAAFQVEVGGTAKPIMKWVKLEY